MLSSAGLFSSLGGTGDIRTPYVLGVVNLFAPVVYSYYKQSLYPPQVQHTSPVYPRYATSPDLFTNPTTPLAPTSTIGAYPSDDHNGFVVPLIILSGAFVAAAYIWTKRGLIFTPSTPDHGPSHPLSRPLPVRDAAQPTLDSEEDSEEEEYDDEDEDEESSDGDANDSEEGEQDEIDDPRGSDPPEDPSDPDPSGFEPFFEDPPLPDMPYDDAWLLLMLNVLYAIAVHKFISHFFPAPLGPWMKGYENMSNWVADQVDGKDRAQEIIGVWVAFVAELDAKAKQEIPKKTFWPLTQQDVSAPVSQTSSQIALAFEQTTSSVALTTEQTFAPLALSFEPTSSSGALAVDQTSSSLVLEAVDGVELPVYPESYQVTRGKVKAGSALGRILGGALGRVITATTGLFLLFRFFKILNDPKEKEKSSIDVSEDQHSQPDANETEDGCMSDIRNSSDGEDVSDDEGDVIEEGANESSSEVQAAVQQNQASWDTAKCESEAREEQRASQVEENAKENASGVEADREEKEYEAKWSVDKYVSEETEEYQTRRDPNNYANIEEEEAEAEAEAEAEYQAEWDPDEYVSEEETEEYQAEWVPNEYASEEEEEEEEEDEAKGCAREVVEVVKDDDENVSSKDREGSNNEETDRSFFGTTMAAEGQTVPSKDENCQEDDCEEYAVAKLLDTHTSTIQADCINVFDFIALIDSFAGIERSAGEVAIIATKIVATVAVALEEPPSVIDGSPKSLFTHAVEKAHRSSLEREVERFLAETHEHIQDENEVSINSQAEELPALAVTADVPQYSEPTAAKVHGVGDKLVSLSVEINEMTGEGRETGLFGMETLDQPRPALDVPKCLSSVNGEGVKFLVHKVRCQLALLAAEMGEELGDDDDYEDSDDMEGLEEREESLQPFPFSDQARFTPFFASTSTFAPANAEVPPLFDINSSHTETSPFPFSEVNLSLDADMELSVGNDLELIEGADVEKGLVDLDGQVSLEISRACLFARAASPFETLHSLSPLSHDIHPPLAEASQSFPFRSVGPVDPPQLFFVVDTDLSASPALDETPLSLQTSAEPLELFLVPSVQFPLIEVPSPFPFVGMELPLELDEHNTLAPTEGDLKQWLNTSVEEKLYEDDSAAPLPIDIFASLNRSTLFSYCYSNAADGPPTIPTPIEPSDLSRFLVEYYVLEEGDLCARDLGTRGDLYSGAQDTSEYADISKEVEFEAMPEGQAEQYSTGSQYEGLDILESSELEAEPRYVVQEALESSPLVEAQEDFPIKVDSESLTAAAVEVEVEIEIGVEEEEQAMIEEVIGERVVEVIEPIFALKEVIVEEIDVVEEVAIVEEVTAVEVVVFEESAGDEAQREEVFPILEEIEHQEQQVEPEIAVPVAEPSVLGCASLVPCMTESDIKKMADLGRCECAMPLAGRVECGCAGLVEVEESATPSTPTRGLPRRVAPTYIPLFEPDSGSEPAAHDPLKFGRLAIPGFVPTSPILAEALDSLKAAPKREAVTPPRFSLPSARLRRLDPSIFKPEVVPIVKPCFRAALRTVPKPTGYGNGGSVILDSPAGRFSDRHNFGKENNSVAVTLRPVKIEEDEERRGANCGVECSKSDGTKKALATPSVLRPFGTLKPTTSTSAPASIPTPVSFSPKFNNFWGFKTSKTS